MGKTVALVVGLVAMVAIAVAAPVIAVGFLGLAAGSVSAAIATAVIGAGLSVALALGMRALVGGTPARACRRDHPIRRARRSSTPGERGHIIRSSARCRRSESTG
jgi:hypothetical protein